ncbi:MAG TPA: TolC family protein [Candidatus Aquilonibacter sp.]|nr:TolC family protein [Candidatus Aquilonibacter sp.]
MIRRNLFPILLTIGVAVTATGLKAQQNGAGGPAQGSYTGSVPLPLVPGVLPLSLQEAIDRGLKQNLGLLLANSDINSASGQRWQALAAILPHVSASPYIDTSQVDLAEFGFSFSFPGVTIPSVVGPFSYFDARANLSENLLNFSDINKSRAAKQQLASARHTYQDARDLVVLSVGYSYLQVIASEARVQTAQAQVDTAQALYDQAADQVGAGTSPQIDELRAQVELKTEQQQLIAAKNDVEIQKLALARTIGLAPGQQFDLTDKSPYSPFPGMTVDEALKQAYAQRSDFQAAMADVHAAEYSKRAAQAEYYPSVSVTGDYGVASKLPNFSAANVYDVRGTVTIPIFQGGQIHGDIQVADAQLQQARDRLDNLRGQIDSDVRTALLNLQSSQDQVNVAQSNIALAQETLQQSRDRFSAGVTNTVEVVQAQEQVASANENYIEALYSFNYAKISLARALGMAEQGVEQFFK